MSGEAQQAPAAVLRQLAPVSARIRFAATRSLPPPGGGARRRTKGLFLSSTAHHSGQHREPRCVRQTAVPAEADRPGHLGGRARKPVDRGHGVEALQQDALPLRRDGASTQQFVLARPLLAGEAAHAAGGEVDVNRQDLFTTKRRDRQGLLTTSPGSFDPPGHRYGHHLLHPQEREQRWPTGRCIEWRAGKSSAAGRRGSASVASPAGTGAVARRRCGATSRRPRRPGSSQVGPSRVSRSSPPWRR